MTGWDRYDLSKDWEGGVLGLDGFTLGIKGIGKNMNSKIITNVEPKNCYSFMSNSNHRLLDTAEIFEGGPGTKYKRVLPKYKSILLILIMQANMNKF